METAAADPRPPNGAMLDSVRPYGGVAERTMAPVLKTGNPHGFMGSNPIPSAIPCFNPNAPRVTDDRT